MKPKNQCRAIIENIEPTIQNGKFPINRVVGEIVQVAADVFADGHDIVKADLLFKHKADKQWERLRMEELGNDSMSTFFTVEKQGYFSFKIQAWVDHASNWQHGLRRKVEDGQNVTSELQDGIQYLDFLKTQTQNKSDLKFIERAEKVFVSKSDYDEAITIGQSKELETLFTDYSQQINGEETKEYLVYVDREKARFSTWYEFFPRSASKIKGEHGSFKDCERLLPRVAKMGFDTLYFPPIHPIGEINRKGKNNATTAEEGDVGSPWGIGSKEGGHKFIHPALGNEKSFQSLIKKAKELGIEIAMDFALQAAPDHPYVKSNPEWFKWRPDGTVQYAENPPKKYQDILPIHFESADWKSLWDELLSIAMYWVDMGIRVFRVDNPHTKPFHFWGWIIAKIKEKYPDVIFLSEAFTKPKVMQQLAKQGFTQSYTYFTWRNTKEEIQQYLHELTQTKMKEYFRPNFWPNTPDINPWELQTKNEAIYLYRHFLAATLCSNYGIYGPVFEFMQNDAVPGKEEYLNSEKYQLRHWDWTMENKLTHLIAKINQIRKEQPALQQTNNIQFCETQNDKLISYYKWNDQKTNHILCVVNLDPYYTQKGVVTVPRHLLGIDDHATLQVHDLITNNGYHWHEQSNYIELAPHLPYHLFRINW